MIKVLLIGTTMTLLNLVIQVWAVTLIIQYFQRRIASGKLTANTLGDSRVLGTIMVFLFLGHILQFATWGFLFLKLGEFEDFTTAFYHSAVNFTSLGYGDIVMSEDWRILGGLEAANGVLMFGLSAGLILSVMNGLLRRHGEFAKVMQKQDPGP